MREIKFRAWDKNLNEMRFDIKIPSDYTERHGNLDLLNMFQSLSQRYVFMQYTGLKDKNGKQIYEGDILKCELYFGAVEWIEDWAMFAINNDRLESLILWASVSEIIGNIYENPELLKGDEDE